MLKNTKRSMPLIFMFITALLLPGKVSAEPQQAAVVSAAEGELYVDKKFKFEIRSPRGWFKVPGTGITYTTSTGPYTSTPCYQKHAQGKGEMALPMVGMLPLDFTDKTMGESSDKALADEFLRGLNNVVDFARIDLRNWEEMGAKVIEAPHEIEVNGTKGARFVVEKTDPDGKVKRVIDYTFIRGDVVVSISGVGWLDTFDTDIKDFETVASSFKFID